MSLIINNYLSLRKILDNMNYKRISISKITEFLLFALLGVLFPGINLYGQDTMTKLNTFSVSGQFHVRGEFRDGVFRPLESGEKPAGLISDRIRFTLDYSYNNKLELKITPQSIGVWGQSPLVQGAENSGSQFSLFETWVKLSLNSNWNTQIGRQVISLDDERMFGALDWAQGGRAHDAIAFNFAKNKYEFRAFASYNQNYKALYSNNLSNPAGNLYSTQDATPYKWMQTIWTKLPINEHNKVTLLVSNLGFQNAASKSDSTKTYFQQTMGANYFYNNSKVNANISAYYQVNDNSIVTATSAYLLAGYLGYNVNNQWNIGLGADYVSGNKVGQTQTKNQSFNPYFGTNHKFYGAMDYYFAGNGHRGAGLSDNYLKIAYKMKPELAFSLAIHQFFSPNTIVNNTTEYNTNLGQEFDLGFSYKINKFASMTGGYSAYATTPSINYLKNTPNGNDLQHWAWLSLNITPTFFETKY